MKGSEFFPSKYLKAEDITDLVPMTVTIKSVVAEALTSREKGEETKPVVYFSDLPEQLGNKGIILNKTNWYMIASLCGDDSNSWTGKRITLVTVDIDAFGDVVSAIRVKKTAPKHVMLAEQAGEVKTPKGKRVADLTPSELEYVLKMPDSPLRQAVVLWTSVPV